MSVVSGHVEKIVFRNDENGYSVIEIFGTDDEGNEDTFTAVGSFPQIDEGSYIQAEGQFRFHQVYGEQLSITSYQIKEPEDIKSIERYLSSGAIKGIGDALASRIVGKFKEDTLRIIEEEPERLAEIKGISERMAMNIAVQFDEKRDLRQAMLFLGKYGVGNNLALRIYKLYGSALYSVIKENPYRLADDISGVGFKIADDIAIKAGIPVDSRYRIKSGILYALSESMSEGNMFLPKGELCELTCRLLEIENSEEVVEQLTELQMEKKIIVKGEGVYLAQGYYAELNVARMLHDIDLASKIAIITGGPGTGKTTNIKKMIVEYESKGLKVSLAAPTGRAAKRMQEATEHEAKTIHRLLEVKAMPDNGNGVTGFSGFERDEDNPIEADVVIIDEMSMVDVFLFNYLLRAISPGTKLILVGDTNQLPSVGPGNVLHDIIESGEYEVKRLNKIYRQAAESDIVVNAHRIINNEKIDIDKRSRDFLFIKRDDPEIIISAMLTLVKEKLPKYVGADTSEIQIMTPMRKGVLGADRLNTILQSVLNPPSKDKVEKELSGTLWREGDKVMQIKNDYQLKWEIKGQSDFAVSKGEGIYNGDIGVIREINAFAETVTIEYDDDRQAEYDFSEMDEVEHAYAITIHKSQGSEYPAAVVPVFRGPRMLMTRNLIYTAITRAKKCIALVGVPSDLEEMIENTHELTRYSGLCRRIREINAL